MENPVFDGQSGLPADYDYRMYDRIWQRVSPDLTPYPQLRSEIEPPSAPEPPSSDGSDDILDTLPGAEINPCCMGSQAQESIAVLAGFIDEELAESRWFCILSRRVCQPRVRDLLQQHAAEKKHAAKQLRAAYYLITGNCHIPTISLEQMQKEQSVCQTLRFCYHQEACNGFNYRRAGDETTDICLQKLFGKLSKEAYRRADELLRVLSTLLR